MATLSVRDSKNSPRSILRRICNARRPCPCTRLFLFFHNKATPSTPNSRPQPTHKPIHTPKGGSSPDFFQLFTSSSPHCHNGRSCFDSVTDRITQWGISVKPYKTGFRGRNCIFYCLQTPGASGQNKTGCEKISQPVFALFFASKYTAKCSHPSGTNARFISSASHLRASTGASPYGSILAS